MHSLYSSMQVTVQPLIRPLQPTSRNQPVQVVAPIVYSFRQPNYANRMSGSYVNNKSVQTTNSGTEKGTLNIDDDNFGDILGYVRKNAIPAITSKELKNNLSDVLRNALKVQRSKSKENVMEMAKYNFQDIIEPFTKGNEGTAKSQYLSVSRYVAGQTTEFRKDSLKSYMGDDDKRDRESGRYSKQSSGKCLSLSIKNIFGIH